MRILCIQTKKGFRLGSSDLQLKFMYEIFRLWSATTWYFKSTNTKCFHCQIMVFVKYKYKGFWVSHSGICEIAGWSVAKPWFKAPSTTCPRADIYCNWKTIVKYWKANIMLMGIKVWRTKGFWCSFGNLSKDIWILFQEVLQAQDDLRDKKGLYLSALMR